MYLDKIIDPRDKLEKAKKRELVNFAQANGLGHITFEMPAILIRKELRRRGMTNIQIENRPLGASPKPTDQFGISPDMPMSDEAGVVIDAEEDLARQFGYELPPEKVQIEKVEKEPPKNTNIIKEIAGLRKEAKARGIKIQPTDSREIIKAKLGGKIAP